mmetsp:Transcript_5844/g.18062  ORF Transcript_5844/g.18062 Transcript_5844/m.18062 type:complete len:101 (+) Transcript_5844:293-595(+)
MRLDTNQTGCVSQAHMVEPFSFSGSAADMLKMYGQAVPEQAPMTTLPEAQAAKAQAAQAPKPQKKCQKTNCTKTKCSGGQHCKAGALRKKAKDQVVRRLK